MNTEALDTNMQNNILSLKNNKKPRRLRKQKDLLSEKNKEKKEYERNLDKNKREKTRTKRYFAIWGLLTLNILILSFIVSYFNFDLEKKWKLFINPRKKCEPGYYLPYEKAEKDCKKCSVDNCQICIGNETIDFCLKCQPGFKSIYKNKMIQFCVDPTKSECQIYNNITKECELCNNGYFLAFFNETKKVCSICSIENCLKCFGSTKSHICINCQNGYFIPSDDKYRKTCKKYSEENCLECIGTQTLDISTSCPDLYEPINGNCEKLKNVIKATYNSTDDKIFHLINGHYEDIIIKEIIDNIEINPPKYAYSFQSKGRHEVIFYFNLEKCKSLKEMFSNVRNVISIYFLNFDTQNITDMSLMFSYCISLISINFSDLKNIENVLTMEEFFSECHSLQSIDLSNLFAKKLYCAKQMFYNCFSLKSANISNFLGPDVSDIRGMFENCISLTSIDFSSFEGKKIADFGGSSSGLSNFISKCPNLKYIDISSFAKVINIKDYFDTSSEPNNGTIKINKTWESYIKQIYPKMTIIIVE